MKKRANSDPQISISTAKEVKRAEVKKAIDILFKDSLLYGSSSDRLIEAFNIFKSMDLAEKKDFIMRVFKHVNPDDKFCMGSDLKNFKLSQHGIKKEYSCDNTVIEDTLIDRQGYIGRICSQLNYCNNISNNSKDGKISVHINNDADLTEIRIGTGKNLFSRIKNDLWVITIS